jgi:PAS domain S-box-containing protein
MQSGQKPETLIDSLDLPQVKNSRAEQMEEALRQSERKYRIIFEKSPLGVVCFNSQGTVLDFNEKFIEIMGSTREKLVGFNAAHQSTPTVQKTIKKAMSGRLASCEESYTSVTGGKKTYLRGIFSPIVPGQSPTDVIATIEDITDQKEHEKELHKIEKLESLGILAGGIAPSILVMDDEEMIRDIAEAMLTHLGYNVTTCSNGKEAVESYRESLNTNTPFRAVIVDLTIPGGVGGLKAAEQILAITPKASLIVSSGYSNDPIMANYRKYGFSAAIGKPYSVAEFEMALRSLPQHS